MYYLFGYFVSLVLSIFIYNKNNNILTAFYHLYFSICSTLFVRGIELVYLSIIYFVSDLLILFKTNTLNNFTLIHHIFAIITSIYLVLVPIVTNLADFATINEASTIILNLAGLGIINKQIKQILFPIVFIICRFIIFNVQMYKHILYDEHLYVILFMIGALNLINIYIVFVMGRKYINQDVKKQLE